jgi:hypothetical protein
VVSVAITIDCRANTTLSSNWANIWNNGRFDLSTTQQSQERDETMTFECAILKAIPNPTFGTIMDCSLSIMWQIITYPWDILGWFGILVYLSLAYMLSHIVEEQFRKV